MTDKLRAIWQLCVAVLFYPLALAALIWIGWTGRWVGWGIAVIAVVLLVDRTWWLLLKRLLGQN